MAAPRRALVVDDDPNVRELEAAMLRVLGLEVQVADDGWPALGMLSAARYDVLLTDVQMPGLDGVGLLQNASQQGLLEDVAVLACSGVVREGSDTAKALKAAGAGVFLRKPFGLNQLRMALRAVGDPSWAAFELDGQPVAPEPEARPELAARGQVRDERGLQHVRIERLVQDDLIVRSQGWGLTPDEAVRLRLTVLPGGEQPRPPWRFMGQVQWTRQDDDSWLGCIRVDAVAPVDALEDLADSLGNP